MPLNIEIEVQDRETLTLEIIDAPFIDSVVIDDAAGPGDTDVTWSADKSSRELADKVDKVSGYSLVDDDEIAKLLTVEQDAQKNTVNSVAGKQGDVLLDKEDVGLSEVDNTSDADKPVSDAAAAALDGKVDKVASKQLSDENYTSPEKDKLAGIQAGAQVNSVTSVAGKTGAVTLAKSDVGLGNVDNTSDANKPVSTATQTALNGKQNTLNANSLAHINKGAATTTFLRNDGTWSAPVSQDTTYTAGTGLSLAGTTFSVKYGSSAGTAAQGNDPRLSDSREWSAATVSQAEAEAGTSTTRMAWTAQRVRQAVESVVRTEPGASTIIYNYDTDTYDLSNHRITDTHKACRRCLLSDDGNVNYYLDQHNSNKKEDGTDADLSGADGQVMVEIPRFWFGVKHVGREIHVTQSPIPQPGLIPHPVFTMGGEYDHIYVGAYNATVQQPDGTVVAGLNLDNNASRVNLAADKLASLSGGNNYAMVGLNLGEFRTLANSRGGGWEQFSFLAWQALQILGYTYLGSFNGQSVLGNGNVSKSYPASSSVQSDSPHTLNGASNSLGNESGATNDFMSLLGVENLWGNCWQWTDGVLFQDSQPYISSVPASTITADYTPIGSPLSSAGASGSYLSEFQSLHNSLLFPSVVLGDSSKFVGDGFWWSGGMRGARVGGSASIGARCGLACLYAAHAPGIRNRSIGGRVMFKKKRGER